MSEPWKGMLGAMLSAHPNEMFAVEIDFESGNQLRGTVGPIINGNSCAKLGFRTDPTDKEVSQAIEALDFLMGKESAFMRLAKNPAQLKEAQKEARRWLGLQ